jgi:hypothetical protein
MVASTDAVCMNLCFLVAVFPITQNLMHMRCFVLSDVINCHITKTLKLENWPQTTEVNALGHEVTQFS